MPEACARLGYERRFTAEEQRRLALGIVPRNMEDKWFIFFEDGWLYLHRSWTGACIYRVRLAPVDEGCEVAEAWVRLLRFLVDRLLLGLDAPFPVPEAVAGGDKAALYRHHVVGHERTNDEDQGDENLH
jgi:hypothetical protein